MSTSSKIDDFIPDHNAVESILSDAKKPMIPTIVILGKTGQGKSTLLNFLMKGPEYLILKKDAREKVEKELFMTSSSANSATVETTAILHQSFMAGAPSIHNPWGRNDDGKYYFIDTPGMADSSGQDIQFLRDMI